MAKTHLKYVDKEQIPVKKYLYILRCILSSQYILDYKKQPPIEIERLIECELPEKLKEDMNQLLMIKKSSDEKQCANHMSSLDEFMMNSLKEDMPFIEDREVSWDRLNDVFRLIIDAYQNDV